MSALMQVAIDELPGILAFLKAAFRKRHPSEPEPSNEEVIAAYRLALASSLAKDEQWLAAHPE